VLIEPLSNFFVEFVLFSDYRRESFVFEARGSQRKLFVHGRRTNMPENINKERELATRIIDKYVRRAMAKAIEKV